MIPLVDVQSKLIVYCPFGCEVEDMDDQGYCHHLVGFTSDNKIFEPLSRRKDGRPMVTHKGRQPVLKTDVLVNPETRNKDGSIAKAGVSSRVYRKTVKKPEAKIEEDETFSDPQTETEPQLTL